LALGAGPCKINRRRILVLKGLSMRMRALMGSVLRRAAGGVGASGFELMLVPSREDSGRYAIESVKVLDRRRALEALRNSGLMGIPSLAPSRSFPGREERGEGVVGEAGSEPRITFIRLAPRQALSMFDGIRRRDPDVRKLYAHLEARNLDLIWDEARGSVMRACAADGTALGEGIVVELAHRRADGAEASFQVSIKDWTAGGAGEVRADYAIRRGKEVEIYEIQDGRAQLVKSTKTSRRTETG
jgi:hypothetical protein